MKLEAAREIVTAMVEILRPYCEKIEIGGSIRRGKPEVKDAEIVAIPKTSFLSFTDELVTSGAVEKALYGETKTTRWGDKYRGMLYRDLKIELFLTDVDSWGYIWWLRTGPGDANTFIMQWLKWKQAPIQAKDGAWWRLETHRLRIATEEDMFGLLKMPYIAPAERSVELYRKILNKWTGDWLHVSKFVIQTVPILPPRVSTPYLDRFCRKRDEWALKEYALELPKLRADAVPLRQQIDALNARIAPLKARHYDNVQDEATRKHKIESLVGEKVELYWNLQDITAHITAIEADMPKRVARLRESEPLKKAEVLPI